MTDIPHSPTPQGADSPTSPPCADTFSPSGSQPCQAPALRALTGVLDLGEHDDVTQVSQVLTALIDGRDECVCWIRSEGSLATDSPSLVGWGRALTLHASGKERTESLRSQWRAVIGRSQWDDAVVRPGTGPLSFGTITFSANSTHESVLVVPEVIVGCDAHGYWLTVIEVVEGASATSTQVRDVNASGPRDDLTARWAEVRAQIHHILSTASRQGDRRGTPANTAEISAGTLSDEEFQSAVDRATKHLAAGDAVKVVLARDLRVTCPHPPAMGTIAGHLAASFPTTWTFVVDSMVGATPELLVRLSRQQVHSRVLAGTARRAHASDEQVETMADWLMHSPKNRREHEVASRSAIDALEPLCAWVEASEPFILRLPNVLHVATDIRAKVAGDTGALALVDALHPTAAVCGTPRQEAAMLIDLLEHQDRGRYSGPVGWVDWHGEGEWCIALRCACRHSDTEFSVWGGGGIMPDSQPHDEWEETRAKMRPMLDALGASSSCSEQSR